MWLVGLVGRLMAGLLTWAAPTGLAKVVMGAGMEAARAVVGASFSECRGNVTRGVGMPPPPPTPLPPALVILCDTMIDASTHVSRAAYSSTDVCRRDVE